MRLVALSDLHGQLPNVPACDVAVIAGDICPHRSPPGSRDDVAFQCEWLGGPFREWLERIPAAEVVACWGNHDWVGQLAPHEVPGDLRWQLLTDSDCTIDGVRFWGSPWSLWFYDWAFNAPRVGGEEFMAEKLAPVPADVGVLIVHGPPLGYGDRTVDGRLTGSQALLETICRVEPRLSVHGHIHEARGTWQLGRTTVANASILDEKYRLVHEPMEFEL